MNITMFQTCDPIKYNKILEITSITNKIFCKNAEINYNCFVGYKRGCHPWHAAFNRITYFYELLKLGYDGWCLYLDTDAFVVDLKFDIYKYLHERSKNSIIICPVNPNKIPKWDVNNGVMFLNFSHPHTKFIVERYFESFANISNDELRNAPNFHDIIDDQQILQNILKKNEIMTNDIYYENPTLINSDNAIFIRQILRSISSSFDDRIMSIKKSVAEVVPDQFKDKDYLHFGNEQDMLFDVISASYQGLLERPPEDGVLDYYGPNITANGIRNGLKDLLVALKQSGEFKTKFQK